MNRLIPSTNATKIVGHLDYVQDGFAYGWAHNAGNPLDRLTIDIFSGDRIVGHGTADQFREDLRTAGIGDGKYAFRLAISYELYDNKLHELTAVETGTEYVLSGAPHTFGPETIKRGFALITRDEGIEIITSSLEDAGSPALANKAKQIIQAYSLGARLQETNQLTDARYVWESIIKSIGNNALCHCKIAETHMLQNHVETAIESYRNSAAADIKFVWAHLGLSNLYRIQGQFEEAEDAFELALSLKPPSPELRAHLKHTESELLPSRVEKLISDGRQDAAIHVLVSQIMSNPENGYITNKLNNILPKMKQHSGSIKSAKILADYYAERSVLDLVIKLCQPQSSSTLNSN